MAYSRLCKPGLPHHWLIRWSNPYTQPPAGWPRTVAHHFTPNNVTQPKPAFLALWKALSIPPGYGLWHEVIEPEPKRWSEDRKRKAKAARDEKRKREAMPLFYQAGS